MHRALEQSPTIWLAFAVLVGVGACPGVGAQGISNTSEIEELDPETLWWVVRSRWWHQTPGRLPRPTLSDISQDKLTVSWTAPESEVFDIVGYRIEYRAEGDSDYLRWVYEGTATQTTITGLRTATEYRVRVRAVSEVGEGDWSAEARVMTTGTPPRFVEGESAAREIEENAPAGTAVGDPVTATVSNGALRYSLAGADADKFLIDAASGQLRTREGVDYDHESRSSYAVEVLASDADALTGRILVRIAVLDVDEPPGKPAAPIVSAFGSRGFRVTWSAPANTGPAITGYDLQYRARGEADYLDAEHNGTGTSATITNLASETLYEIRVRAENDEGIGAWSDTVQRRTPGSGNVPPTETCTNGRAGEFPCDGISLYSRVALSRMGGGGGNDLWGWADSTTGREYALMGMTNGTAFVDVSDPASPVFLGRLPTQTSASLWRDIKVYGDHAYIVADGASAHGMQVFDLARLRGQSASQTFTADVVYDDFGHAHNLAVNPETGFAYAVSTNTCGSGLHIMDIRTPDNPRFAGCHSGVRTHDTQCVLYHGADSEHRNREVCFSSNEGHLEVVDVTDKSDPTSLSSTTYPQLAYVHQGWLTEDHRFFLLGDELDETNFGVPTRTHVFDMTDLDAPEYLYAHELDTRATDHNLYVLGDRIFEANYTSGLRVLRFGNLAARDIAEVAHFDTFPESDDATFRGAWSVYPYLPSGTVLVSDISRGLFVLSME